MTGSVAGKKQLGYFGGLCLVMRCLLVIVPGSELPPEPSQICVLEPSGMVQIWAREEKLSRTTTRVQYLSSPHGSPVQLHRHVL